MGRWEAAGSGTMDIKREDMLKRKFYFWLHGEMKGYIIVRSVRACDSANGRVCTLANVDTGERGWTWINHLGWTRRVSQRSEMASTRRQHSEMRWSSSRKASICARSQP